MDEELDALMSDFVERLRRSESPQVEEYCQRAPALADEIRSLFPLLRNVEAARDGDIDLSGADIVDIREARRPGDHALNGIGPLNGDVGQGDVATVLSRETDSGQLGDFRLLRIIGRGGMGIVYEAIQESLGRRVALKVPAPHVTGDERLIKRFHREARAAGMLHHTNIVPVFGVGCEKGVHYLVMQFISGTSLDRVFARGLQPDASKFDTSAPHGSQAFLSTAVISDTVPEADLPGDRQPEGAKSPPGIADQKQLHDRRHWEKLAGIGVQVADALDYAHRQGVLHRDIKPSNLLLDENDTVWVADFGLAKLVDHEDLTHTQDLLGTLRYLAPERFQGTCDARSDIYSLGLMLYEFASGKRAFEAANKEAVLQQIARHDWTSLRAKGIDIPLDLETIILKSISRNPSDRYQSAAELAQDFRLFIEDRPIQARRLFWTERLTRWASHNRGSATLLGAIAALLIVIAVGSVVVANRLKDQRDSALEAKIKATTAERAATQAEAGRRKELARTYLTQLQVAATSKSQGQRIAALAAARGLTESTPVGDLSLDDQQLLRDSLIRACSHADLSEVRRIPVPAAGLLSSDIDPTFEYVAEPSDIDQTTVIRHLQTGELVHLANPVAFKPMGSHRRFSPCGRWLWEHFFPATVEDAQEPVRGRLWEWRQKRLVLDVPNSEVREFSGDGNRCIITHEDRIQSWDLTTGKMLGESSPGHDYVHAVSISSDGRYLCCKRAWHPLEVFDAGSLQLVTTLGDDVTLPAQAFDWHPHEPTVHVGRNGRINRWSLDEFERWMPLNNLSNIVGLRNSRYGRFMAVESLEGTVTIVDLGLEQRMVEVNGQLVRISEDENQIAVRQGSEIVQYRYSPSSTLTKAQQTEVFGELSPDGHLLAVSGNQGVEIWSTQPLRKLGSLGLDFCGPASWSPDGQELVTFGIFSHACRWPVVPSADGTSVNIGPPTSIQVNPYLAKVGAVDEIPQREGRHAVYSQDGRVMVYSDFRHGKVWQVVDGGAPEVLGMLDYASRVAISPNARYVSGSVYPGDLTVIWDRESRQEVLRIEGMGAGHFSRDGKWFACAGANSIRVYEVETWKQLQHWPVDVELPLTCPAVFHPDGVILAAPVSRTCVRLFDCQTGQVIANLNYQDLGDISWLSFSRDGNVLAVTRRDLDIGLWNLPSLRSELNAFGIDLAHIPTSRVTRQDSPALGTIDRGPHCPEPGGWWIGFKMLGQAEMLKSRWHDAIVDFDQALEITPPDAKSALVDLWMIRAQCELHLDNHKAALANYRKAAQIDPGHQEARRAIARLLLYGPKELHDPIQAGSVLLPLSHQDRCQPSDKLDLAFALQLQGQHHSALPLVATVSRDKEKPLEKAKRLCLLVLIHRSLGDEKSAEPFKIELDSYVAGSNHQREVTQLQSMFDLLVDKAPEAAQ